MTALRVLLIEDDLDTLANLRDILELDGYAVETAASVAQTMIDRDWGALFAIVVDRRLPDGNADAFLPRLRELAPRAAVIVVTGNADLETAVGAIRHGIADFIPKPVDPDMLRASLARTARLRDVERIRSAHPTSSRCLTRSAATPRRFTCTARRLSSTAFGSPLGTIYPIAQRSGPRGFRSTAEPSG